MGGTPRAGFQLLGLVVSEPGGSLFLKFTGPSAVVEAERERFLALAESLGVVQHGPGDGHDHGESGMDPGGGAHGGDFLYDGRAARRRRSPRLGRDRVQHVFFPRFAFLHREPALNRCRRISRKRTR